MSARGRDIFPLLLVLAAMSALAGTAQDCGVDHEGRERSRVNCESLGGTWRHTDRKAKRDRPWCDVPEVAPVPGSSVFGEAPLPFTR